MVPAAAAGHHRWHCHSLPLLLPLLVLAVKSSQVAIHV
jgi:hypothetical protein